MTSQTDVLAQEAQALDGMSASSPFSPRPDSSHHPPNPSAVLNRDTALLQLLVRMTFRLRLRGVDLESSTGLSGRELDLIALLGSSGPTSVKSLVADLRFPRSTMTAIVDRLEARGLVKRRPNSQDRRSIILESTPSASEALLRYRDGMRSFVRHLGTLLDQNEQEQFIHLVKKIDESL